MTDNYESNANSELSYIIRSNPGNHVVEIEFSDVPPEAVRNTLVGLHMRYNSARRVWYGCRASEDDLREAVEDALAGRKGRFAPGDGTRYTIRCNDELGSVEVEFDGRPSEAVREAVRGIGMRWHRLNGYWYSQFVTEEKVKTAIERAMAY